MINIKGIDKPTLLAALYNNSRPLGMGFLHYTPEPMTPEQAANEIAAATKKNWQDKEEIYFDYLHGRVMKVNIAGDELDPWAYDRDNGQGACQKVVDSLTRPATA